MICINLFGGPGVGKSTLAAEVFADLKKKRLNCELVTEYAKDLTWQESFKVLKNQIYVWAKQHQRLDRLKGKVEIVVTDSPYLLSVVYDESPNQLFHQLVFQEFNKNINLNFYIERTTNFEQTGRNQDLTGAQAIDKKILDVLNSTNTVYWKVRSLDDAKNEIISIATREIDKIKK